MSSQSSAHPANAVSGETVEPQKRFVASNRRANVRQTDKTAASMDIGVGLIKTILHAHFAIMIKVGAETRSRGL